MSYEPKFASLSLAGTNIFPLLYLFIALRHEHKLLSQSGVNASGLRQLVLAGGVSCPLVLLLGDKSEGLFFRMVPYIKKNIDNNDNHGVCILHLPHHQELDCEFLLLLYQPYVSPTPPHFHQKREI